MKINKKIALILTAGVFSCSVTANPCAYMAPIIYTGFSSIYYEWLEKHSENCFPNTPKSSSCKSLEEKFNVDMGMFFSNKGYRKYIRTMSHDPIMNNSKIAIGSTIKMLDGFQGNLKEAAKEEIKELNKIGSKLSIKAIKKSLNRMTGVGLCS